MFFEKYRDSRREFRWRLKSRNGRIVASGESYKQEAKCDHAIELIKWLGDVPVKVVDKPSKKIVSKPKKG